MKMPKIGLGTAFVSNKKVITDAVIHAGYRHIDTASLYHTEGIIGEALQEIFSTTNIKREDIFITTKLIQHEFKEPEEALNRSLANLKLDYVDLYLIHWPDHYFAGGDYPLHVFWAKLEKLVDGGKIKSLGVSNYNV